MKSQSKPLSELRPWIFRFKFDYKLYNITYIVLNLTLILILFITFMNAAVVIRVLYFIF